MIDSIVKTTKATRNVKFFVTSRKEHVIGKSLRSVITLQIGPHHIERDIQSYVRVRTSKLGEIFSMDAERQKWITTEVTQRAHGMFLFARLVMDNLMNQDCEEALEDELKNEILPQGIDEAYGRILIRMQKKDQASKTWQRAKLALELIVRAKGSVRTYDIQGALSICIQDRSVKFEQRRSVRPLEELLGPMVEVHSDNLVTLVHPTAKDYLLQHHSNFFIDPSAADFRLASLCTSYLTHKCFSPSLPESTIKDSVERADYAFQEYATFNWIHHLESLESYKLDSSRDETSNFRPALALLHQHYLEDNLHTGLTLGEEGKDIDISEELNAWKIAYERVEVLRQGDGLQNPMPYPLRRLLEVRRILEELPSQANKALSMLTEAYGICLYKCPIIRCTRFFSGFTTGHERDKHVQRHERSYKCLKKDCDYSELGFASEVDLKKHVQICHGTSSEDFIFPNVRPISTSKALKDAIDRDDALAIRDICDSRKAHTIKETGFLLRAVKKRKLNAAMVVMELLGTTSEVNHRDQFGRTAFHEAMIDVEFEILLKEILKSNFDIRAECLGDYSPLKQGLLGGHFHAVNMLLSVEGISLESCSGAVLQKGVLKAAAEGKDDTLQTIFPVAVSAIPVSKLSKWISAILNDAAFHNHESTISLILKLGRSTGIEKHYEGTLQEELPKGLEAVTKLLMKRAVDPEPEVNSKGKTKGCKLQKAAERGDSATVIGLLEKGADINYGNRQLRTALAAASRKCKLPMMKLLLEKGAKVDARGGPWFTALGVASSKGHIAAIQLLLKNSADPQHGICLASREGHEEVVKLLLEHGADVDGREGGKPTALIEAAYFGHENLVKMLLKQGADTNAQSSVYYKYNALTAACTNGKKRSLVKLLLDHGADPNRNGLDVNAITYSALSFASRHEKNVDIVRMLLERGADVNAGSGKALKNASDNGSTAIVQLLREYGAKEM